MNPYLSREEKANFVRVTAMLAQLEDTIEAYSKARSIAPEFLRYLKTGRTWLAKAMTMRGDALDADAKLEFAKQASRMTCIFVPTAEAKKANAELLALKTTLPMEAQDFEDWYETVIEATCKICERDDYADCNIRRVLTKYGVYPIDPEACGKCQYSYAEPFELSPKLQQVAKELLQADPLDEVAATAEPVPEELANPWSRLPVIIGLHNGSMLTLDLPATMATNLLYELKTTSPKHRAIIANHIDGELVVIDMQDVVTMQVAGIDGGTWERLGRTDAPTAAPEISERSDEREQYRVECKCGAEYVCNMNPGRYKARCRQCNGFVFADREAVTDDGATLLTNRYRIDRVPPVAEVLPARNYADPCNPFID